MPWIVEQDFPPSKGLQKISITVASAICNRFTYVSGRKDGVGCGEGPASASVRPDLTP